MTQGMCRRDRPLAVILLIVVLAWVGRIGEAFVPRAGPSSRRGKTALHMRSFWPMIDVSALPWPSDWSVEPTAEDILIDDYPTSDESVTDHKVGVILVDHGSRKPEANALLSKIVEDYKGVSGFDLVEPAHMELAEPSIAAAFGKCVEQGATFIVCHPFFLARGRHVSEDIPNLMEEAAAIFPGVEWAISEPLGCQVQIPLLVSQSVNACLRELDIQPEDD